MNLRIGYSVVYKLSRTLELDPKAAAWFYLRHGTMLVDVPATIPVFMQVSPLSFPSLPSLPFLPFLCVR